MEKLYILKNRDKYLGNPNLIYYRSSWEHAFLQFLEESPVITAFNSEEVCIPYFYPLDKKWHRYYVDFFIELKHQHHFLIEIKPFYQRIKPFRKKELGTFIKNQSKWEFASRYAENKGMQFLVLDEYDLKKMGVRIPINNSKRMVEKKILFEQRDKYGQSVDRLIKPLL